ncbi:MAG: ATP-dependent sacrificial sulfur transferase LarE, partial [Oscillospiraceae bacterium]|nr:ATP-dependent sacrificial sulfur transferase LarE [Oscillospiraceae bacterium]
KMTLSEFFTGYNSIGIALSGGVDSIYLMYAAKKSGAEVRAYFAKTEFTLTSELADAEKAAQKLSVPLYVMEYSAIEDENIVKNTPDRCYFRKRAMMQMIGALAYADGCEIVCDGTNASDDVSGRPGFRALAELGVISPLRICGIDKDEVRRLSRDAGLEVWDKPSNSCLATRIKTNERITEEKLSRIHVAECFLRSRGFTDFRVRLSENHAQVELSSHDKQRLSGCRMQIEYEMKKYFESVFIESEARK